MEWMIPDKKYDPEAEKKEAERLEKERQAYENFFWGAREDENGNYFPQSSVEAERRAVQNLEKLDRDSKFLEAVEKRNRRIRDLSRDMFTRILPTSWTARDSEMGERLYYERLLLTFYYDYLRQTVVALAVFVCLFFILKWTTPIMLDRYERWIVEAEPAVFTAFDDSHTLVVNIRTLNALVDGDTLDRHVLDWIRGADILHLEKSEEISQYIEYPWFNGKWYNVTLAELKRAARTYYADKCSCAAHFGVPLHIAFLGKKTWVEPVIIEFADPKKGMTKVVLRDPLVPETETYTLSTVKGARAEFLVPAGVAREELRGIDLACVTRCMDFANRKSTFDHDVDSLIHSNEL